MDGAEDASAVDRRGYVPADLVRGERRSDLRFVFSNAEHVFILV